MGGGPGAVSPAHDLEHRTHDEAQPRDHRRPGIGRGVRLGRGQLRHGETARRDWEWVGGREERRSDGKREKGGRVRG